MEKYICATCDYVYDPEAGDPDNDVAPGTSFADLPDDWECPLCGVGKDEFDRESQARKIHLGSLDGFILSKHIEADHSDTILSFQKSLPLSTLMRKM